MKKFGFTPEAVLEAASTQVLAKPPRRNSPVSTLQALKQLEACGQSPWIDFLLRSFVETWRPGRR